MSASAAMSAAVPPTGPLKVLVVKTSSMGDVVHALAAVTDLLTARPGSTVDWLVEKPFAALPGLHPGVRRVLPIAWRKWRKALGQRATWALMGEARAALQAERYDLVVDLQGLLLKSVLWGRQAHGPLVGYDWGSAREPLASLFYDRKVKVPRTLHAVERSRRLMAAAAGYAMPTRPADFGIRPRATPAWLPPLPAVALIPCASRPEKLWPEDHWMAVGQRFKALGLTPVVVWGSPDEQARAERIAAGCGGVVPPFLSVQDMGEVLGRCRAAVGLDTGFSHLAAAFALPTVGIYCDHEPGLVGITGPAWVRSLGGRGQRPSLAEVMALVDEQIAGLAI
ncbi:lipopolysaccharide heptosyltransferase I [Ideonella livida]|uniref:Lipopolysaccharide heptosyltransferase 1 n=1 Tax=Ideonella livida TaxID=2707176 RepID=A0A7C9TN42_9BURK|nr:lipopolysaccharide heptosyltransferase I [Ideonella livida]NDY93724.1 lipopolysaccharide heptosyltransferase I [Ideonella livida]